MNDSGVAFYAGVPQRCKECHKKAVRGNRARNADYYREFDRTRSDLPHRVDARRAYAKTPKGRVATAAAKARWTERNRSKRAAHYLLNNALRDGKVAKPKECQGCGATCGRIHGHHDDYARPLDVRWLCPACHSKHHAELREAVR